MRFILIVSFAGAFLFSLLITAILRRVAPRIGLVDRPSGHKLHDRPMPVGGGIAIVAATCLVIGAAAVLAVVWKVRLALLPVPDSIAEDVRLAAAQLPLLLHILGAGFVLALFGLWDDMRPTGPLVKLAAQFVVAGVLVFSTRIRITLPLALPQLHGFAAADWVQMGVTVVWIVVLANSFNLLDNMDGLCGTVGFICAGALLIVALQTGQLFVAGFMLALMGAMLGFLYFNFPPAGIFMGDMGSMFIGYMLATATILTTFVTKAQLNPLFPLVVPLIIFAVPLYDSVSVVLIRFSHRRSILMGDQNHFSHRIARLGMSRRRVLFTIALVTLATSLGATVPYGSPAWRVIVPAVQALAVICVIVQLELVSVEITGPSAEPQENKHDGADREAG
ncbi:MAG: MraY family glycosyltransferase [Candidatus Brocadiia bacterium]|nr:MraY family glycosyltransferase [Candidatus Brocadiia bacterium]